VPETGWTAPPRRVPNPNPPAGLILAGVLLALVVLLLGGRMLLGAAQRHQCGAEPVAAAILSAQALGARPDPAECLGLALSSPAPPTTPTPPEATTTPPEPEPTVPFDQAERDCDQRLGLQPNQHLSDEQLQSFHDCMQGLGHWVPVD
jgi:hypothetical protein